eukprot:364011-Chlamydomonas_euryale.AAC.1
MPRTYIQAQSTTSRCQRGSPRSCDRDPRRRGGRVAGRRVARRRARRRAARARAARSATQLARAVQQQRLLHLRMLRQRRERLDAMRAHHHDAPDLQPRQARAAAAARRLLVAVVVVGGENVEARRGAHALLRRVVAPVAVDAAVAVAVRIAALRAVAFSSIARAPHARRDRQCPSGGGAVRLALRCRVARRPALTDDLRVPVFVGKVASSRRGAGAVMAVAA